MMEGKSKSIFAQRLSQTRRAKGWNQMQFSELLDVDFTTVVYWETDRRKPRIDKLFDMVKLLDVSADSLLGLDA